MSVNNKTQLNDSSWHIMGHDAAMNILDTSTNGLSSQQASQRLTEHGLNRLQPGKKRARWHVFCSSFITF